MTQPKTRLSDLDLSMVSLVPRGDDPMAKAVLYKSADRKNHNNNDARSTVTDHHEQENSVSDKNDDKTISKDDLDPAVVAYIEALEEAVTETDEIETELETVKAELATAKAAIEKSAAKDDADDDTDPIAKAIAKAEASDPGLALILKAQQAEHAALVQKVEDAEKVAKAERDDRELGAFVSKAAVDMKNLTAKADDLGAILKSVHDVNPDAATKIAEVLKAASAQVEAGDLFKELGAGGGGTTVSASVEAAAKAIQKADPNLTPEAALAKAYDQNPDAYDEALRAN